MKLYRASIAHTPRNPFEHSDALETYLDGGLLVDKDLILELGEFLDLERQYPKAKVVDYRGSFIVPGLVDCHVHFPQVSVIGTMGVQLLEWLETRTLPEEEKLEDPSYAREVAEDFLSHLVRNGTTTALVFGAHFKNAMHEFFQAAEDSKLRITSGMVFSDRELRPKLHQSPQQAFSSGAELLMRWHNRGRLRYAVMPRFSLSCSDKMLEVCSALLSAQPGILFHTHINENLVEIKTVKLLSNAPDYLESYERHNLVNARSVFAHSVHPSASELARMAKAGSSVAHCASSNAFIGSGLFPMRAHLEAGVHVALGSDVGGGTGFSLLKEGLEAYQMQMLHSDGLKLTPVHLLYLATSAGAKALHLEDQIGDFTPGKQADFIVLKAPKGSTLESTLQRSGSLESSLGALFTLAREESLKNVFVAGEKLV
jgi:guanine deaminase